MRGAHSPTETLRHALFTTYVPWGRLRRVVDVSRNLDLLRAVLPRWDGIGELVLFPSRHSFTPPGEVDRIIVHHGGMADVPAGADYYLLPGGLDEVPFARVRDLMKTIAEACPSHGRVLACLAPGRVEHLTHCAESVGLEVTRSGGDDAAVLIEYGTEMTAAYLA